MSAPRRRKPRKGQLKGLSRREFLTRSGLSVAAIGMAPLLPGCSSSDNSGGRTPEPDGGGNPPLPSEPVFRHGVASGDPLADAVILWTRVTQAGTAAVPVDLVMATDPQLSVGVLRGQTMATSGRDFTAKIDMAGLAPATTYYYQFSALGQQSPVGRTRTLPVGDVDRLRIAVLSCSNYAHGFFNAYARVAERADLDLVLHLGDYIYEYGNGGFGNARTLQPPHEIVTLEDYRTRHGYYKLEPELQQLHRQHPLVCVWDDHESANDAWRDGAENHQPDLEGPWPARRSVSQRAYEEWMPIRAPDPARIFRQLQIGTLVDLLMLDTRLFARSQQLPATLAVPGLPVGVFTATGDYLDPTRELLGAEQENWLFERLRSSGARWKLLGQQVMFGQLKLLGLPNLTGLSQFLNPDQWDGYPLARGRVFATLRGDDTHPPVDNAVILTGDIHTAWAMDITEDPNNLLPALGGYNALNGAGSLAVEFVATSVTSPGLDDLAVLETVVRLENPHVKFVDLAHRGYLLLDITPARCQAEFWTIPGIDTRSGGQSLAAVFQTAAGANRLSSGAVSAPRANPPAPAPG